MKDSAADDGKSGQGPQRYERFQGHLRVRELSARAAVHDTALRGPRARVFSIEIFERRAWRPMSRAAVDERGEMTLSVLPLYRGKRLSSAAIRAVTGHLREDPFSCLTAEIPVGNVAAAKAFESAGFLRVERAHPFTTRYALVIRDECSPYNVWI